MLLNNNKINTGTQTNNTLNKKAGKSILEDNESQCNNNLNNSDNSLDNEIKDSNENNNNN